MGRIPDHLVSLAVRALENRWVTIGAKADSKRPGKKKGGTPVELDGEGKITKGPAALTGKRPSELSQSHLFTGQDHKSQRKLFAEPGDPPPPPPIDETPKTPAPAAKKEPKPRAKKPLSMSLLAVIRREGGISSGDFEHADFKEFGLLGALNKKGLSLDDMAATMVRQGHMTVPMGKSSPSDHLLQLLKKKTNSLLAADTAEYDKDYEAYMQAREEAQSDGYPEEQLAEASGRGEEAGDQESKDRLFDEIFGGDGSGGEEAGRDEEPGDLAGDSAEPAGGVDTSFDFGPAAAPKVEEKPKAKPKATKPEKTAKQDEPAPPAIEPQAPTPPPPATNLFGQPEPTKPQPATTQGLFGEQVPVEDPKVKPRETVADQAEKGLDWLYQKQDPKTDGTGEMFGGLFSPGRTSGATEPEAGPAVPPAVEPSAPAPKATSLPDRIKNLKVLLNKTRSRANAKALRTAIDQLEREAKGPVAAPAVEPSSTATAPAPQSQSFDDYRRANAVKDYTIDHSMLSPSGRVSGRSANATQARVDKQFSDYNQAEKEYQAKVDAGEIVDPKGKYQKPDQAKANKGEADLLRNKAKQFRSIAASGMQTRKLTKQAEELERQANELDPVAKAEAGPVAAPKVETAKPAPFTFSLDPSGRRGDTAEVNIPFSKRGDLNAQIDRFKKTQKAEQKKQDRLSRELKGPGKPSAKVEQSSGGDETQVRRMIRQNEKDRNRALQTIANLGPNAEAQAYADKLGKENERLKANLPKSAQPGTAPKVEAPETNVIGKGSTGEVVKIGNEVHKNAKGPEGKIYKELSGVDGIAKGRQEGDKIITPHFKNTLSRDDVPRGNRQSFGPVVKKNLSRIVGAVNALSEKGYDYNDPLQIGFDNDRSAHLFDFSNAQKSNTATQDNLSHLGTFLSEFGLPRHGDAVSKIAHLFDYLNNQDTRDFDSDSQESKDATKVLSQLGGQVPKFAYYTFNARAVPNVAQTEKEPGPNGAKLVFSTKPLNKNFMDTWEIMPAIHKDTTTESARIRAFLREAV